MKVKYIVTGLLLTVVLSSCVVSKKKYDTLYSAKLASDRKVRNLLKEKNALEISLEDKITTIAGLKGKLSTLKEEFNNLKYDMSASNAQKSSEIDKLSKKLDNTLKDKASIKEKTQELEGDLNWLRKQRQLNTEKIDTLEATIKDLENQVKVLEVAKQITTNSLNTAQQKIEDLVSKVNATQELLNREKATNIKLQKQLSNQPVKNKTEEAIPEI